MTDYFKRDDLYFSLCGLNCSLCPMFVNKTCSGCIKDSMCYNICNIVPCSLENCAVDYCFECEEYPCKKYDGINQHDSMITHINQLNDIEKAKQLELKNITRNNNKKYKY